MLLLPRLMVWWLVPVLIAEPKFLCSVPRNFWQSHEAFADLQIFVNIILSIPIAFATGDVFCCALKLRNVVPISSNVAA